MLIEFSVGNFRSFHDRVTFSMVAANLSAKDKTLDENNTFEPEGGPRLLTSAAVYGANASGKSNLVRAIGFMRGFVLNSPQGTRPSGGIEVEPFRLSTASASQPSHFEIVFIAEGRRYRYGFEVTAERVEREWLLHVPRSREARLFERLGDAIQLGEGFREGKEIGGRTRPNALFLAVVAQFNGPIAQAITGWFRDLVLAPGLEDAGLRSYTIAHFVDGAHREEIRNLIKRLDLGIDEVMVENVATPEREAYVVRTVHKFSGNGGQRTIEEIFDLDGQESEGTQRLFALAGPVASALKTGQVLVIDEFDARLHPLVTREMVGLFNSKTSNPHHAQLIFTTQDTNLLDNRFFRRDQIWFTEKDRYGATHLYSLAEFKVRNDASFERDYVRGRYGAIPYLGELRQIMEEA